MASSCSYLLCLYVGGAIVDSGLNVKAVLQGTFPLMRLPGHGCFSISTGLVLDLSVESTLTLVHPQSRLAQPGIMVSSSDLREDYKPLGMCDNLVVASTSNRCTIESIASGCITVWYGNCSSQDSKELHRVMDTTQSI
eukprot:g21997.t1